jgi:DnaB-like helicase N terminal domain
MSEGNGNGNGQTMGTAIANELPPQNLQAERWLLSGLLIDNEYFPEVLQEVSADDFYRDAHQVLFRAMTAIYERGDPVDAVSVVEELNRRDQFKSIGGDDFLVEVANAAPHAANCIYHAKVVRQKSISRQSVQISNDHTRAIYSNLFTAGEALERTINRLSTLCEGQEPDENDGIRDFPAPPGEAAFHGVMGQIVREIEPYTEASSAAILFQLLVGFGSMVGRGPHWVHEADTHRLNLYLCLVGNTADGRKGTSWGYPRRILTDVDPAWENRIAFGINSGPALIEQVADEETTRTGSFLRGVPDKRLFMHESEFTRLLAIFQRDSETLGMVLRQAWETDHLAALSKKNPVRATGAHVSVNAHVTHDDLHSNLSLNDIANGLGNRFIWVCTKTSKEIKRQVFFPWRRMDAKIDQLKDALEGISHWDDTPMGRSRTAQEFWEEQLGVLRKRRPGLLGAILARGPAQVMRLAGIYAAVDKVKLIEIVHLKAALELWSYSVGSIDFIFGERLGDPDAERLLAALEAAGTEGLSQSKIQRQVFGNHKDAPSLSILFRRMLRAGLIRRDYTPSKGGRPACMWVLDTPPPAKEAKEAEEVLGIDARPF